MNTPDPPSSPRVRTGLAGFVAGAGVTGGTVSLGVGVVSAAITCGVGSCAESALDSGNPIGISVWLMGWGIAGLSGLVAIGAIGIGLVMLVMGGLSLWGATKG